MALLTENQIQRLVSETTVTVFPTATRELGHDLPKDLIYEKGVASDVCTLILGGKVTVIAGADEFRSDVSIWTVLGYSALQDPDYKADFTAFVASGPCRCIQFTRELYNKCLDASVLEKHNSQTNPSPDIETSKQHSVAGTASSAMESTLSDFSEGGSEIRNNERKSKLLAALQIASGSASDMSASKKEHTLAAATTTKVGFAGAGSSDMKGTSINEALGMGKYQPKGGVGDLTDLSRRSEGRSEASGPEPSFISPLESRPAVENNNMTSDSDDKLPASTSTENLDPKTDQ